MIKNTNVAKSHYRWRNMVTLLFIVAAIYFVITNIQIIRSSFSALSTVLPGWLLASIGLTAVTFIIAAAIYQTLSLKPIHYFRTLVIELAAACANRLLPAGVGSLGLHGLYLYKQRHTSAGATAVVSVNNLVGIFAHLLLLACVLVLHPDALRDLRINSPVSFHWWYIMVLLSVVTSLFFWQRLRQKAALFLGNVLQSFHMFKLSRIVTAFALALLLTTVYTGILYSAAHSLGLQVTLLQAFIVFSVGMLTGTATPTPGGLVGAEAGLFAGFVAYGVTAPQATAAVILYRLVTYWLPLLPGAFCLVVARQRQLV